MVSTIGAKSSPAPPLMSPPPPPAYVVIYDDKIIGFMKLLLWYLCKTELASYVHRDIWRPLFFSFSFQIQMLITKYSEIRNRSVCPNVLLLSILALCADIINSRGRITQSLLIHHSCVKDCGERDDCEGIRRIISR